MKAILAAIVFSVVAAPALAEEPVAWVKSPDGETVAQRSFEINEATAGVDFGKMPKNLVIVALWGMKGKCPIIVTDRETAWAVSPSAMGYKIFFKDEKRGDYYGLAARSLAQFPLGATEKVAQVAWKKFCPEMLR